MIHNFLTSFLGSAAATPLWSYIVSKKIENYKNILAFTLVRKSKFGEKELEILTECWEKLSDIIEISSQIGTLLTNFTEIEIHISNEEYASFEKIEKTEDIFLGGKSASFENNFRNEISKITHIASLSFAETFQFQGYFNKHKIFIDPIPLNNADRRYSLRILFEKFYKSSYEYLIKIQEKLIKFSSSLNIQDFKAEKQLSGFDIGYDISLSELKLQKINDILSISKKYQESIKDIQLELDKALRLKLFPE